MEICLADAEFEFPGSTNDSADLVTIWRMLATPWVRKHLVARTRSGRAVMWDDGVRLWCTVWTESTWPGEFVQLASRAWLDDRLKYAHEETIR